MRNQIQFGYRITGIFRGFIFPWFSWLRSKPRNIYPRNSYHYYRCNEPRSLVHAYTKPRNFSHENFHIHENFPPPKNTRYTVHFNPLREVDSIQMQVDNCAQKRVCPYNLLTQRACSRSANYHVARNWREIRIGCLPPLLHLPPLRLPLRLRLPLLTRLSGRWKKRKR